MTRRLPGRLNAALLPLGVVALVAGCGGGSAMSTPGGGTTYIPPAGGKQMTTATLKLLVPGRRPSNRLRSPQYVSPYTSRVDVAAVSAGAASPWPIATSTAIPSPGPLPSGASPTPIPVTMTVPVSVGSDQFSVSAYDSSGSLLSGTATGPISISTDAANSVSLTLNAAADCVSVNNALGGTFTMKPFENQTGAQTATFTLTPCDADGYPIPAGANLANTITFATPAPVSVGVNSKTRRAEGIATGLLTFSPSTITQGGTQTVTVTYPANSNAPLSMAIVPSPFPSGLYGGYGTINADPLFLALVSNHDSGTLSVLSSDVQGTAGITQWSSDISFSGYLGGIVGGGPQSLCSKGGQAVVFDSNGAQIITLPTPGPGNPTPPPSVPQPLALSGYTAPITAASMDTSCNIYAGDSGTSGGLLFSILNNGTTTQGGPFNTAGYGGAPITATAWVNGNVYVGLGATSGYLNNIMNASPAPAGTDTKFGGGTQAMVRYDATTMVVAYQVTGGDVFLARWDGVSNPTQTQDMGLNSYYYGPVKGMAVDPAGNVWAVTRFYLYEYNPLTSSFQSYSLPAGSTNPTGIAIASNGMIFITDAGSSPGTISMFNSANIAGGLPGNVAQAITTLSVGTNPNGVVIVP